MSKEKQCKCCHEWWYDSDVKENLCPNCYDYFKQLKQQLAEKDKEINSLIADYKKRISQEQELMSNMEHRLAEKQNTINEINKEFVQAVHDWKALCAEKDKEIENCKRNELYEENMKILAVKNQKQLAIQELEKVKEDCFNQKELVGFGNVACFMVDIADILEIINNQIKELKGEQT